MTLWLRQPFSRQPYSFVASGLSFQVCVGDGNVHGQRDITGHALVEICVPDEYVHGQEISNVVLWLRYLFMTGMYRVSYRTSSSDLHSCLRQEYPDPVVQVPPGVGRIEGHLEYQSLAPLFRFLLSTDTSRPFS